MGFKRVEGPSRDAGTAFPAVGWAATPIKANINLHADEINIPAL
jgi:hypothetical protein